MSDIRTSSEGRPFDAAGLDEATLAATTADGDCEFCGRERLHTLGGQSTYGACTRVARDARVMESGRDVSGGTYLYFDEEAIREAGYEGLEDRKLDEIGLVLDSGRSPERLDHPGRRKTGPCLCEGRALEWARELEEEHPELWWSSLGFEED